MSLFPKIARPCPYVENLDAVMDGDFCRMCKRQVHDLTDMDRAAREAFLAARGGDVCVRYTVWMKPAMAAAALAVTGGGMSVLAASLDQPPRKAVDQPGLATIMIPGEPRPVVGEPIPVAGGIGPLPEVEHANQDRHPPVAPRKMRPPKPVRLVEADIPYVTAGLPVPVEPLPSPSPTPPTAIE